MSVCLSLGSTLPFQVQGSGIFSLTCLQQFLQQAEPADAVCCAVLPDLCIDIQTFHVALVDIFISQLGATLGVFYLNQVD